MKEEKNTHISANISINRDTGNLNIDSVYNILLKNEPAVNGVLKLKKKSLGDKIEYKTKENCVNGRKQQEFFTIK